MLPHLSSAKDWTVGFVFRDDLGWVLRSADKAVKATKRVPKRAPAIVHMSGPDFLRWVTSELAWASATDDGRIQVVGDPAHVEAMFGDGVR